MPGFYGFRGPAEGHRTARLAWRAEGGEFQGCEPREITSSWPVTLRKSISGKALPAGFEAGQSVDGASGLGALDDGLDGVWLHRLGRAGLECGNFQDGSLFLS